MCSGGIKQTLLGLCSAVIKASAAFRTRIISRKYLLHCCTAALGVRHSHLKICYDTYTILDLVRCMLHGCRVLSHVDLAATLVSFCTCHSVLQYSKGDVVQSVHVSATPAEPSWTVRPSHKWLPAINSHTRPAAPPQHQRRPGWWAAQPAAGCPVCWTQCWGWGWCPGSLTWGVTQQVWAWQLVLQVWHLPRLMQSSCSSTASLR
jgi:hypothetical protein